MSDTAVPPGNTTPRVDAANLLLNRFTPFELALAIVDAAAGGGSQWDWDSETIEVVGDPILRLTTAARMPDWTTSTQASIDYWTAIAES